MNHCCSMMTSQVDFVCEQHKDDMNECTDKIIKYDKIWDEYGLVFPVTVSIQFNLICVK